MSTPVAAQAETAAPATPAALPDSTSAAASKFVEAQDAKAKAKTPVVAKVEAAKPEKQKPRIDPNLIKREREATEATQRARAIEDKFKPLQERLSKKDIRGAISLLAADHGVTFADFVEVLKSSGDEDESVEKKAERIARETIEKAKAKDAEEATAAETERRRAEAASLDQRIEAFRGKLQAKAESESERWPSIAVAGTGGKAWDALEAFHTAGVQFAQEDAQSVGLDVVEEAHDLVKSHFGQTKQRLDIDKAVRLVVDELAKLGADGARAKLKEARNPSATGNARNEAGEQRDGGRAAEPRINNRTTSGATGVVPARDPDAPVTFGKSAVDDVLRRLPALAARIQ